METTKYSTETKLNKKAPAPVTTKKPIVPQKVPKIQGFHQRTKTAVALSKDSVKIQPSLVAAAVKPSVSPRPSARPASTRAVEK